MKIRNADDYLARWRRRGDARAPKSTESDGLAGLRHRCWPQDDHAYRSKPRHAARAVALPLRPLGPPKRPAQREHPHTLPLSTSSRIARYMAQTGRATLTPRQVRRAIKKENRGW